MKKRKRRRVILFVFILLFVLTAVWLFWVWTRIYQKRPGQTNVGEHKITNILILGIDQSDDETSRADSIIVMSINKELEDVSLVSIPRDSRVEIPGFGLDKINHAMAYNGVDLLRPTVENLLDVPLHYYILTNFAGFENIIDTIGGVVVNVERQIIGADGRPIVEPGLQPLTGRQALTYVRFRSDAEGDFGRMRRQQQVLKAMGKSMMQPKTLIRLPALMEQFAKDVRTDMSPTQLLSLGRILTTQEMDAMNLIQLRGTPTTIDGISYVILDEDFLRQSVERYLRWETEEN